MEIKNDKKPMYIFIAILSVILITYLLWLFVAEYTKRSKLDISNNNNVTTTLQLTFFDVKPVFSSDYVIYTSNDTTYAEPRDYTNSTPDYYNVCFAGFDPKISKVDSVIIEKTSEQIDITHSDYNTIPLEKEYKTVEHIKKVAGNKSFGFVIEDLMDMTEKEFKDRLSRAVENKEIVKVTIRTNEGYFSPVATKIEFSKDIRHLTIPFDEVHIKAKGK